MKSSFAKDDDPFRNRSIADVSSDFELPEASYRSDALRTQRDFFRRTRRCGKLHRFDRCKPEAPARSTCGESGGLRKRFHKNHARNNRVTREMTAKERFLRSKRFATGRRLTGLQFEHGIDEDERRTMRESQRNRIGVDHRLTVPSAGTK